MTVIARGLLVPMVLAALAAPIGAAWAQSPFPPVSGAPPSGGSSPFPSVKGPSGATGAPQSSQFPAVGSGSPFPSVNGTRASLPSASLPPQTEAAPAGPGFGGGPPQGGGA